MIYRGTVRRVAGVKVWVEVQALAPGFTYEASVLRGPWTAGVVEAGHAHTASEDRSQTWVDLDVGDNVLVAAVAGNYDDLIVLGLL